MTDDKIYKERSDVPLDIKKEWFSLIRRLQSVAKSEGLSVITFKVLVDKEGNPLGWTSPKRTLIEPKSKSSLIASILDMDM